MSRFAVITKIPDDMDGNYATGEIYICPKQRKETCNENFKVVGTGIVVSPPGKILDKLLDDMIKWHIEEKDGMIIDLNKEQLVPCLMPVFKLGEILVLNEHGRAIPDGRKPGKWFVEYEVFDNIEAAIKRAQEVNP
jgi:hypothetical protein